MGTLEILDAVTGLPWRTPPPWAQLVLPGLDLPVDRWDLVVVGPGRAVRVRATFHAEGLALLVNDREPDERAMAMHGHAPPEAPLAEFVVALRGSGFAGGSSFGKPLSTSGWSLGPKDWSPAAALGRLGSELSVHVGAGRRPPALLAALLADVAERVTRACDPRALPIARAFHRSVRLGVHALVAGDASGRLAQLATVAPGLVTMMASGRGRGAAAAVIAGEPLRSVADALVKSAWPEVHGAARLRQRRWLLRAPACLDPACLDRLAPADVPLDDIPARAAAASFYEVIAAVTDEFGHDDDELSAALAASRRGLLRFASRHAVAIHALERWEERLGRMMHRALRTGAYPTRRAPLEAWLPAARHISNGDALRDVVDGALGTALRLDTESALDREAEEMRHCVHTYSSEVETGHVVVLRLEAASERATLALTWDPRARAFRVTDFAGPGNRPPGAAVVALARRYLAAHRGLVVVELPPARDWRFEPRWRSFRPARSAASNVVPRCACNTVGAC